MNDITELDNPTLVTTKNSNDSNNANQFNEEAKQLKSLVQGILDAPELDTVKINRIKKQIANGDYKIDANTISKKIIESIDK